MSATPYTLVTEQKLNDMRAAAQARGIDPRLVRPDGSIEDDGSVPPEQMLQFLRDSGAVEAVDAGQGAVMTRLEQAAALREIDGASGEVTVATRGVETLRAEAEQARASMAPRTSEKKIDPFQADDPTQQMIFTKVARYLDPRMKSPLQIFAVRHKLFVMKIPTSQELLDVTAFTGAKMNQEATIAENTLQIIGECIKGCHGWVPENSADAQLLRAHFNDPQKWPALRPIDWLASRDSSAFNREALPLWEKYKEWRESVEPTPEEIDFYYSRLG